MKYVLIRAHDGSLLAGGIYKGGDDGFVRVFRNDNEMIMVNLDAASAIHFFVKPPEVLIKYMNVEASQPEPEAPPQILNKPKRSGLPSPEELQNLVEAGPPGMEPSTGIPLSELPIPKIPRKRRQDDNRE